MIMSVTSDLLKKVIDLHRQPLINLYRGELTLEWWNELKKLTIYSTDTELWFIKMDGENMEDGSFKIEEFDNLINWLYQ